MRLPGRLKSTTLGDLLGQLHRERADGTLELVEGSGRRHRVHVATGLVVAVELDGGESATLADLLRREAALDDAVLRRALLRALASSRLLGEVLVSDFRVPPAVVASALRRQIGARLARLERIVDAQVFFRVTVRPPRGALTDTPLGPREFLAGRRRARDRGADAWAARSAAEESRPIAAVPTTKEAEARALLGVDAKVDALEIKRAYRRLVRETHPDLHPTASEDEKRALAQRFVAITAAYHTLVA